MKSRNGFVSNSSSSSFIVQWKCNMLEDDEGIDRAIIYLFDLVSFDGLDEFNEKLKDCWFDDLDKYEDHLKPTIKAILENTKPIGKSGDMFETKFLRLCEIQ